MALNKATLLAVFTTVVVPLAILLQYSDALPDLLVVWVPGTQLPVELETQAGAPEVWKIWTRAGDRISWNDTDLDAAALVEGLVIAASGDNEIFAVRLDTGELVWNQELDCFLTPPPLAVREIVVVSCPRHVFGFNSSNGELVWTSEKLWVRSTASAEGLLLVADVFSSTATENELLAIEPTSGSVVWRRQIPGLSVMAVSSNLAFAAAGNNVVQLNVEDGSIVRSISLKEIEQVEDLMVSGTYLIAVGPESKNLIVDLRLLSVSEGNNFTSNGVSLAVPPGTSRVRIQSIEGSLALAQIETTDFAVYTLAFDLDTGAEQWRSPVAGIFDCGSDTSCGWIPGTGSLLAISNATGEEKWRVTIPDGPGDGMMRADRELLIVAGRSIYTVDWTNVTDTN
jgi:outer membrane protein assembly factor BamB